MPLEGSDGRVAALEAASREAAISWLAPCPGSDADDLDVLEGAEV